jgi:hypothetical protein
MLTDNPNTKHRNPPVRSAEAKTNKTWSDKQKLEAVQSWLMLGNLALTARVLNIPEVTIRYWKNSEWWKTAVEEIKIQEDMQMSARLKKIVDASLMAVEDRLLNGDIMYDQKSGEMVRKQVNMRDAHKVAVDLMDKKAIIDKTAVAVVEEKKDEDRLMKLAEKFADFVTQKKPTVNVTDVVFVTEENNALHDQRQTGLQERVREVPLETGTTPQSFGTDGVAE